MPNANCSMTGGVANNTWSCFCPAIERNRSTCPSRLMLGIKDVTGTGDQIADSSRRVRNEAEGELVNFGSPSPARK